MSEFEQLESHDIDVSKDFKVIGYGFREAISRRNQERLAARMPEAHRVVEGLRLAEQQQEMPHES